MDLRGGSTIGARLVYASELGFDSGRAREILKNLSGNRTGKRPLISSHFLIELICRFKQAAVFQMENGIGRNRQDAPPLPAIDH